MKINDSLCVLGRPNVKKITDNIESISFKIFLEAFNQIQFRNNWYMCNSVKRIILMFQMPILCMYFYLYLKCNKYMFDVL